jgi:S-adenosylmethionine hydrolase
MRPIVTLLTDFGTADGYVAEVKGTIMSRAPEAVIVDVAHDIPAHDVEAARLAIARYWRKFPSGTVHFAVVDPGVGSARRALAVESDGRFLVGPDNGLLSPALLLGGARAVELAVPSGSSATFHGRDVFAPAAALLAAGSAVDALGTPVGDPEIRRTREAKRRADGAIEGSVITVDRFGNAVTNLLAAHGGIVEVGALHLPVLRTYADVAPGTPLALVGSSGLIEIAVRDGSAAVLLGLARETTVLLRTARR